MRETTLEQIEQNSLSGFELSLQQKRIWLPGWDNNNYYARCAIKMEGKFNPDALRRSLQQIVNRHEILRTSFHRQAGMKFPVQIIADYVSVSWQLLDLHEQAPFEQEGIVSQFFSGNLKVRFDSEQTSLLQLILLKLLPDAHILLIELPSLCADVRSLENIFQELIKSYDCATQDIEFSSDAVQYVQFSAWQNEILETDSEGLEYWSNLNHTISSELTLPYQKHQSQKSTVAERAGFHPNFLASEISVDLSAKLELLSKKQGIPISRLLLTCWYTLLFRLTNQQDITVMNLYTGREYQELEGVLGPVAKLLPVTIHFESRIRFNEIARQVDKLLNMAFECGNCFKSIDQGSVFSVGYEYADIPSSEFSEGVTFTFEKQVVCLERFNIKPLIMHRVGTHIIEFHYNQDTFEREDIERLMTQFLTLTSSVVENYEALINSLDILSASVRKQLIIDWNHTSKDYPRGRCLHELFEAQVAITPHHPALVYDGKSITYAELNARANQLAHYLQRLGVGPEIIVAICLDRSMEAIVSLLGIVKAGGAYLPLESTIPSQRLSLMLEESKASVVITEQKFRERFRNQYNQQILCIDDPDEFISRESKENCDNKICENNLLYVLFTSGSTGVPKGVAIEHRQLINYLSAILEQMNLPEASSYATVTTLAADLGNTMIFPSLCSGGVLHVISQDCISNAEAFASYMDDHHIDCLKIVPSHLMTLFGCQRPERVMPQKLLVLGGEASGVELIKRLRVLAPDCRIMNHYGPTETTVGVLTFHVKEIDKSQIDRVPLGRPISNVQIYILDNACRPVPPGVAGELFIGGGAVSRGYLNRADQTSEKFIPDPFSLKSGARLYRTGDLVQYHRDGVIEFLGRIDNQVKIRGYRIELGEIESAIIQYTDICETTVLVQEHESLEKNVTAYIVSRKPKRSTISELRSYLREKLPEYMIPSNFVLLDKFPLTSNGKVDRQTLLTLKQIPEIEHSSIIPVTQYEEIIASIWEDLLGLDSVGLSENFFDLGGHSLKATQLISRLQQAFGIDIAVRDLFNAPTVTGIADRIEEAIRGGRGLALPPIEPVPRSRDLPLSFAQRRLWFIQQLEPDGVFYNVSSALRLCGHLNVIALERCLNEIQRRHESLRTTFYEVVGKVYQRINPVHPQRLIVEDLSNLTEAEREDQVRLLAETEATRPFDLAQGPLLRVKLLRLGTEEHALLFTLHHIISDGWSTGILAHEMGALYDAYCREENSPLEDLPIQYADYAVWQTDSLQGEVLDNHISYWKRQIKDAPPLLELHTDKPRTLAKTFRSATEPLTIIPEIVDGLKSLASQEGVTIFMFLLAAFDTLLYRYTLQDDIVIGAPIANRNRSEIERLIGFFLNTLVLRLDLSGNPSFRELLRRARETSLEAYAHQDLPFEKLVEELQPKRSLNRTPLFQVLLIFQNVPRLELKLSGIEWRQLPVARNTSYFDLTLWASETGQELTTLLEYNTELFEQSTIQRMLNHFQRLLECVIKDPELRIANLPLLSPEEQRLILIDWNDTQRDYPSEKCFHELFEVQVSLTPEALAVVCDDDRLTYKELNQRANRLARMLKSAGGGPEIKVGLLMDRGIDFLTAIIGIFKVGGGYLPFDPRHPADRLSQMLEQSQTSIILTVSGFTPVVSRILEVLPEEKQPKLLRLDDLLQREQFEGMEENLTSRGYSDSMAYVIYTSGSTGIPKGAVVEQRGMLNHLYAKISDLELTSSDIVAQNGSQCFDISVWQMLAPLLVGGRVHIYKDEIAYDAWRLIEEVNRHKITILEVTPSLLSVMLDVKESAEPSLYQCQSLRWLISTGESLQPDLCRRCLSCYPKLPLMNAYGPTECSDDVTHWPIYQPPSAEAIYMSIGKPISNTSIYILDRHFQPVPIGVPAEVFIGGDGVGRGYLNDVVRTSQVFLPDPFGGSSGARLYRTGDLARFIPDGSIEFLGRIDHQVKIRGYRIELGEIEAVLCAHQSIVETVVMVRENGIGDKRLVAFLVLQQGAEYDSSDLRGFIRAKLPEYMTPAEFIPLKALPLTPNGKVDRNALTTIASDLFVEERTVIAPRNAIEESLASIWSQALGVGQLSIDDNFFDFGGHSLLATQVLSRIREKFQIELALRQIFEYSTIASLSEVITHAQNRQREEEESEILKILEGLSETDAKDMLNQLLQQDKSVL